MSLTPSFPSLQSPSTQSPSSSTTPGYWEALSQTLFLGAMTSLKKGKLILKLPEGGGYSFGDPEVDETKENQFIDASLKSYPIATIRVLNHSFFKKAVLYGDIGLGESYIDGDWETDDIAKVISWFILNVDDTTQLKGSSHQLGGINFFKWANRIYHLLRPNSLKTSQKNIQAHYDLSNDFFKLFLDPTLTYSSGIFKGLNWDFPLAGNGVVNNMPEELSSHLAQLLEAAQLQKYEALCQKLKLQASDRVLEIGSGWGGFACYAAQKYGCHITTLTLSKEQYAYVTQLIAEKKLEGQIEILLQDYRLTQGQFDKIVSVEMIEAVGDAYYESFFEACSNLLTPHGLMAIQMILCPDSRYGILKANVDFIQKHIFPGSLLPSVGRLTQAMNKTSNLSLFELEDLGLCYGKTLEIWYQRFNQALDQVKALGFDDKFIRKWNYYLMYCKAAFNTRNVTVAQALYTRPNNGVLF
jgi:cyclopropane-fatty-acyl-phospholipid synthase